MELLSHHLSVVYDVTAGILKKLNGDPSVTSSSIVVRVRHALRMRSMPDVGLLLDEVVHRVKETLEGSNIAILSPAEKHRELRQAAPVPVHNHVPHALTPHVDIYAPTPPMLPHPITPQPAPRRLPDPMLPWVTDVKTMLREQKHFSPSAQHVVDAVLDIAEKNCIPKDREVRLCGAVAACYGVDCSGDWKTMLGDTRRKRMWEAPPRPLSSASRPQSDLLPPRIVLAPAKIVPVDPPRPVEHIEVASSTSSEPVDMDGVDHNESDDDADEDGTFDEHEVEGYLKMGIDPFKPTAARPGSEEKVLILSARYAGGIPLWHDRDSYEHGPREEELMGLVRSRRTLPVPSEVAEEDVD